MAAVGLGAFVLAACSGGGDGPQDEVADMVLDEMEGEGVEMDADCVRDAADELSDDDAQKILDAGPDGDPQDLSDDAIDARNALVNCVDTDALVDQMIDEMVGDLGGENVDADCLKEALRDLDLATFDEGDPALMGALVECVSLDG